ncbi:hypothetical protein [Mycobacteroides abscessus]|uniref:hypothetical protein n=1 Tax=Mycobacteroides abscessus TaxID=36809 RepID=UPI0009A850CC|nr:hypothetical protein [Mycobacteroides abscessus]RIT42414.1 hypothetical protein D2E80_22380 [Mycobacteroides abscessus]
MVCADESESAQATGVDGATSVKKWLGSGTRFSAEHHVAYLQRPEFCSHRTLISWSPHPVRHA